MQLKASCQTLLYRLPANTERHSYVIELYSKRFALHPLHGHLPALYQIHEFLTRFGLLEKAGEIGSSCQ